MLAEPDVPLVTALLFGPLLLGVFQHLAFEPPARLWHTSLNKSPYRPPPFVFPIAWIWSYLSMGYSSYLVYTTVSDMIPLLVTGALYILHIALLNSWGFFFFHLRRVDLALNALLALDVLASWLLISVSTIMPFAAVLCLPYFCWLLELTYLNMYMYRNNDQADILGFTKEDVIAAHEEPLREMAPLREAVVPQREKFD